MDILLFILYLIKFFLLILLEERIYLFGLFILDLR